MSHIIDKTTKYIGQILALLSLALAFLITYDAFMRYIFSEGSIALQELEWHIFDIIFLLGLSYALKHKKHVRVDIFFVHFKKGTKAIIEILSILFLLIPFGLFLVFGSFEMTTQSFLQHEISSDPGGLKYRFLIKGVAFLGFLLLVLQGISEIVKAYKQIENRKLLFSLISGLIIIFIISLFHIPFLIDPIWLMFLLTLILLMSGFEVAFVFGGVALLFALISEELGLEVLEMLPYRVYGIMGNITLMSIPLFILMGLILEKSKIAEDLLLSMGKLFGGVRGGLAISVVVVGAILAASTGIVGASVVMMSLIALPLMLKHNYKPELATGSIVASGTLGQIIPPSIVLIVLGDQMHLSVGDLFKGALAPSLILVILYILYILIYSRLDESVAPAIKTNESYKEVAVEAIRVIIPPLILILTVLGSIFAGIASPTESAGVGVVGALILARLNGELSLKLIKYASIETVKLTAMIFMILIGATAFSLVFNELGGQDLALEFFANDIGDKWSFILLSMALIFILGFFIDFIEIAFVVVPILVPIVHSFGIDPVWFAILIALNLQASFLTPPFGFALFYLKGSAKDLVTTKEIYKGVVPFILLQLLALIIVLLFPDIIYIFGG
jgi:tripartite ATP-independent transporter DctM subunit